MGKFPTAIEKGSLRSQKSHSLFVRTMSHLNLLRKSNFFIFPTLNQWRLKSIEILYWIDSLSLVDIYCLQIVVEKRGGAAIYTDFNNGGLLEWIMRLDEQLKKIIIDFHFSLPFLSFDAVLTAKWVILSKYEKSYILK